MKIIFKTKDIEASAAAQDYVEKKMETLARFIEDANQEITMAEVEMGRSTRHHRSGDIFRVEINLSMDGKMFRAESEKEDVFSAIDEVRDSLEQEIKKFKTKKETIFIRGARSLKKALRLSPLARFRNKNQNQ